MLASAAALLPNLKRSPTFAMSRGGRELFHTNFWAFILEAERENFDGADWPVVKEVREALLKSLFGEDVPSRVWVWRERSSLDLVVLAAPNDDSGFQERKLRNVQMMPRHSKLRTASGLPDAGTACVVVEMKFKAIPTERQLDGYSRKLYAGLFLDLPQSSGSDMKAAPWGRLFVQLENLECNKAKFWAYPPSNKPASEAETEADAGIDTQAEAEAEAEADRRKEAERKGSINPNAEHRFAGANGRVRLLLVSPGTNRELIFGEKGSPWEVECPSTILLTMKDAIDRKRLKKAGPLFSILDDYVTSTLDLLNIAAHVQDEVRQCFLKGQELRLKDVQYALRDERFARARLHDLVGKQAYSVMQTDLLHYMKQVVPSSKYPLVGEVLFTRGTPGLNIEFVRPEVPNEKFGQRQVVRVGVQLQGTFYRKYIAASDPPEGMLEEVSKKPEIAGWLNSDEGQQKFGDQAFFGENAFTYCQTQVAECTWSELKALCAVSLTGAAKMLSSNTTCESLGTLFRPQASNRRGRSSR